MKIRKETGKSCCVCVIKHFQTNAGSDSDAQIFHTSTPIDVCLKTTSGTKSADYYNPTEIASPQFTWFHCRRVERFH